MLPIAPSTHCAPSACAANPARRSARRDETLRPEVRRERLCGRRRPNKVLHPSADESRAAAGERRALGRRYVFCRQIAFRLANIPCASYSGCLTIRFYLDASTRLRHIYCHDVSEDEVEEVLTNSGEDRPGRDESRVALGQTQDGRYLRVICLRDPKPDSVFVITACDLRGRPLLAYRRRMRRKK
jgi:hypothetical protein